MGNMVKLELPLEGDEATILDDVLGMWIDGIEAEIPVVVGSDTEAHWALYELRKQRTNIQAIRLRLQLLREEVTS